ncbi:MAG: hypothetical protein ACODAJ_01990 [Planctomycetota bacterium]
MGQEQATCRVCGCELEGRDVYEGICSDCLEEEILSSGGRPRPAKRAKAEPKPAAGPVIEETTSPDETSVDMDADTKELVVIDDEEPQAACEAAVADRDEPAEASVALAAEPVETLEQADTDAMEIPPQAEPPDQTAADTDGEAMPLSFGDDDAELQVAEVPDETGEPPAADDAIELREAGEDQDEAPPPPPAETRRSATAGSEPESDAAVAAPPETLRLLDDDASSGPAPPFREAPTRPRRRPQPATDEEPPSPQLVYHAELEARLDDLESRLERMGAHVEALAEEQAKAGGHSPAGLLVGLLAALGALGLLAAGVLAVLHFAG